MWLHSPYVLVVNFLHHHLPPQKFKTNGTLGTPRVSRMESNGFTGAVGDTVMCRGCRFAGAEGAVWVPFNFRQTAPQKTPSQ